jgi:UDP-glucose 4-epimerase
MPRTRAPRTRVERSLLESASFVRDFAIDNPHVTVTKLRFTNVLGDDVTTPFSKALRLPLAPEVFGFDPRLQFTHETDVTGALVFATLNDVPGVFNVAGDGSLPWSEVCAIVGRRRLSLPPLLTQWAAEPLRIARILDLPPEVLSLLRYGRALDNSPFKKTGFKYQYSTAGTVDAFARSLRLEHAVGSNRPAYKYERDVETFFRHSPAVVREKN